jgi:hypothetical protein
MKTVYTWLVAGMLATAAATPAVQARPLVEACAQVTITDALAYRILEEASGELEAQFGIVESVQSLFQQYKNGSLPISYLGYDGITHVFYVAYSDGPLTVDLDDF